MKMTEYDAWIEHYIKHGTKTDLDKTLDELGFTQIMLMELVGVDNAMKLIHRSQDAACRYRHNRNNGLAFGESIKEAMHRHLSDVKQFNELS